MIIEQSHLRLSADSVLVREQIRIRQAPPAPLRVEIRVQQAAPAVAEAPEEGTGDAKLRTLKLVAELLIGRRISVYHASSGSGKPAEVSVPAGGPQPQVRTVEVRAEAEDLRFSATGSVETADGRRIDFHAALSISRRFVQVNVSDESSGNKKDPLVLNFDGKGVRLTGDTFRFDLTGDGESEWVPLVAPGSGLLFADRNHDGVANDGTELFGPRSGDGFADLAAFDADGNGWIDENDPVFGELRVWFQERGGPGRTYSLADLGVGAISTASVDSPFELRAPRNQLVGQLRASGVYLREDGRPGIVSQVDLVV